MKEPSQQEKQIEEEVHRRFPNCEILEMIELSRLADKMSFEVTLIEHEEIERGLHQP